MPVVGQRIGRGLRAESTKATETALTAPAKVREASQARMAGFGTIRAMPIKSRRDSGPANARLSAPAGAPGRTPGPGVPEAIDCFRLTATNFQAGHGARYPCPGLDDGLQHGAILF